MATSLRLKVYSEDNVYVASCKHTEDAVLLASTYKAGATVRWNFPERDTLWRKPPGDKPIDLAAVCDEVNAKAEKKLERDLAKAVKKLTGAR